MTHDTARRQLEDSVWAIEIPHSPYADLTRELIVEALHAEGYRKHPEPEITDEMVDRAAMALTGLRKSQWEEARAEAAGGTDYYLDAARTALAAALRGPAGEGEQK